VTRGLEIERGAAADCGAFPEGRLPRVPTLRRCAALFQRKHLRIEAATIPQEFQTVVGV